jgi:hypothetical protein
MCAAPRERHLEETTQCWLTSRVKLKVYAGTTYFFQVGGYSGYSGELVFRLRKA